MHSLVAYAAEEGAAQNPLIPAWYDIIWSSLCFVIILFVFWKIALPKMKDLLDKRSAAIEGNIAMGKAGAKDAALGKASFVAVLGPERARAQAEMLAAQAVAHLDGFDSRADNLRALAGLVVNRAA